MKTQITYFDILGVTTHSTQDDIKTAYRELAMKYHPDMGGDELKFKELNDAYEVLSDVSKRKAYEARIFDSATSINDFMKDYHRTRNARPKANTSNNKTITVTITIEEYIKGTTKKFNVTDSNGKSNTVKINIPAKTDVYSPDVIVDGKSIGLNVVCKVDPIVNNIYRITPDKGKLIVNIDRNVCPSRFTIDLPFINQVITVNKPDVLSHGEHIFMVLYDKIEIRISFI